MPINTAAWLHSPKAYPLEIKPAAYPHPSPHQITIQNRATAINPIDRAIQEAGLAFFPFLTYPHILGSDVAGSVIETGSKISRFKIGDRVFGHAIGFSTNNSAERAFQTYTVICEDLAALVPENLAFEAAVVLPLGLSTAACALFMGDYLGLGYPRVPAAELTGETLLVWGGATSVGCNAVQLAAAAGYEVFATVSMGNFEFVRGLGASRVFDYKSEAVVEEIVDAFKGKMLAGAFAAAPGSGEQCLEVVGRSESRKFVATAMPVPEKVPEGVEAKFVFAGNTKNDVVSKAIYVDFIGKALAEGQYVAAPEYERVGKGLECIQAALDRHKQGVSAKKIVVSF